jgi:hypothetical protein
MSRIAGRWRWLGVGLILLGTGIAAAAVLGPLVLGVLVYRTSPTTLHQIAGGDAAALCVVAPATVAVGLLALRRDAAAPMLGLAPAVFALYTYTQLVVGNEHLRLPGNVEAFFPLLLGIFVLAGAVAVGAWNAAGARGLPPVPRRVRRAAGILLVAIAAFVVVVLHLRSYVDAVGGRPSSVAYLSSPTPFWLVKLMDLGIVVPAAVAVGVGLLRDRAWAVKPMYAIVGAYTLLGASVTGMAVTMVLRGDPEASAATLVGSALVTGALAAFCVVLYGPLLRPLRVAGLPVPAQPGIPSGRR